MRVLHIVSGLAPDQRFGGISRVAVDLARRQRAQGHEVRILSTDVGFDRPAPAQVEGVPVLLLRSLHLVPRLGFGTIVSPGLPVALLRLLRGADVVHVHIARETNTLLAAWIAARVRVPVVLQTHGMLDAPNNRIAVLVDALLTRRALRGASVALTLTADEEDEIERLSDRRVATQRFSNGIELAARPDRDDVDRIPTVLFLARLHPRKGAVAFAQAAIAIAADRPDVRFLIAGPDEGDAGAVRELAAAARPGFLSVLGPVPHEEVRGLMEAADLYCLPAEREPFGLTVVEALAAATPVLVHETAALAEVVVASDAGWSFGSTAGLESALRAALDDPTELRRRGINARALAEDRFDVEAMIDRLEQVYREAGERVTR